MEKAANTEIWRRQMDEKHVCNLLKIQGFYWREELASRKDGCEGATRRKGGTTAVCRDRCQPWAAVLIATAAPA